MRWYQIIDDGHGMPLSVASHFRRLDEFLMLDGQIVVTESTLNKIYRLLSTTDGWFPEVLREITEQEAKDIMRDRRYY